MEIQNGGEIFESNNCQMFQKVILFVIRDQKDVFTFS
jgi:hypothetical protein